MVETLVDAVRDIARFDSRRSSFSAWLHGIAHHRIQRERRRQRRSKSVPSSMQVPLDTLREVAGGGDLSAHLNDQAASRQRFSQLASILSDIELEVLVLRCVGELSLKEVGRIVGRSERAAESVLRRAKQKAREEVWHDVA